MQRIAVVNSKGGVGKTTTVVNLAGALAERGKRVLVLDFDPQASISTVWFAMPPPAPEQTWGDELWRAILERKDLVPLVHQLPAGFDLIPASEELEELNVRSAQKAGRDFLLQRALETLPAERWDYLLIDTPGSFNIFTLMAIAAADLYLAPVEAAAMSIRPVLRLVAAVEEARELLQHRSLRCAGVVACRLPAAGNNPRQILDALREHFGADVFSTVIRHNVHLAEAAAQGAHIGAYMRGSIGAEDYRGLAAELEERVGRQSRPREVAANA